jgi:hypothetical protein
MLTKSKLMDKGTILTIIVKKEFWDVALSKVSE